MKQQILNLKKKLLLVELPEGANRLETFKDNHPYLFYFAGTIPQRLNLICDAKLIGKLTDITEQQFKEWVDGNNGGYDDTMFIDYKLPKTHFAPFQLTAYESFFSYLEKEGIYFENKLGKPKEEDFKLTGNSEQSWRMIEEDRSGQKPTWASILARNYQDKLKLWQEAEQKVWNLDNCYIFEIL